jgi:hypothetical protein
MRGSGAVTGPPTEVDGPGRTVGTGR